MKGLLTIEIAGKKVQALFGMYSIKLLTEKREITLNDLGDLFTGVEDNPVVAFDLLVDLLHAGISNYNLVHDINETPNYFKLYNDFGSIDKSQYDSIFKAFLETQISGQSLAANSNDELDQEPTDKKKA